MPTPDDAPLTPTHGTPPPAVDMAPLLAKLDTLVNALNAHTVAVYQWADACNALLNAMLESAEQEATFITDLKGNRIPVGPAP